MGTREASKRNWECGEKEEQGTWGNEGVMGRRKGQVMGEEGEEAVGKRGAERTKGKKGQRCEAEEGEVLRGRDKGCVGRKGEWWWEKGKSRGC
jgi:hypothetical protein